MTLDRIDGDRDSVRVLNRVRLALDAHNEGLTWEQAAHLSGYRDRVSCYRAVMRHLSRDVSTSVTEMRASANRRHRAKIAMLEDVMYDPDADWQVRLRAADAHTRAEARHARINGLDAPVQIAVGAGSLAELDDALALLENVVRGEVVQPPDDDEPPPAGALVPATPAPEPGAGGAAAEEPTHEP